MKKLIFLALIPLAACSPTKKETPMTNQTADTLIAKPRVFLLSNAAGTKMTVTNFGAKVIGLWLPDKNGLMGDIVLGYDSATQYIKGDPYFGAAIGRYGNRIANGRFTLEGQEYQLAKNNGQNALHGGPHGFHNVYWDVKPVATEGGQALEMTYVSKDGEEGYPGNLSTRMIYTLTDKNEFIIDYSATTDKATVVNLTHHSFFNLANAGNGDILGHVITLYADKFLPVNEGLIPTGELRPVKGTPFDFLKPHSIGERINGEDQQLKFGRGYDHCWILNKKAGELSLAAVVTEPTTGRKMEVWTTEPGLQFYTGNFLDGSQTGKGGQSYAYRTAFCLEAQHYPDSPNRKDFPSTVLKPGETYTQRTIYKFDIVK